MKNGKADSKPSMGGMAMAGKNAKAQAVPMMGTRPMSKNGKAQSMPTMGVSDGYDHSADILQGEGRSGRNMSEGVDGAKSTHGSKQTDKARAMWTEGIHSGHDAHGNADTPVKYTGHDSYHKENPGVQTKARADHFRRINQGANAHGDNAVSKQHNNQ